MTHVNQYNTTMNSEWYYETSTKETCVEGLRGLFDDSKGEDKVVAQMTDTSGEVSLHAMTVIHQQLQGSKRWKRVDDWQTEVYYTIAHPEKDITVFDSSQNVEIYRESIHPKFIAACGSNWRATVARVAKEPFGKIDFNMTRYSYVRVARAKYFYHETSRSCWCFKLVVQWEGKTLDDAKNSRKKYMVNVESVVRKTDTGDVNPKYKVASFLEKILDITSIAEQGRGQRRLVLL
ncbi:FirrV-1-B17 [Feldmannia irregularis virus a]|uniref:FirrV-1-B17 n=1 Tax=Feldmannia irregularis virus a TaxID=231992 RepID=Q6XM19_9PHYC|nr:FirrV-1-B17 [Feldmannia irregularis virus a]AAR26892.1 FirrV-1-B17 [Feldmannia irregularis virus a]